MIWNILLVAINIVFWFHIRMQKPSPQRDKTERWFCNIMWFLIVFMAAFRDKTVGTDTAGYILDYGKIARMTFDEINIHHVGYEGFFLISKFFTLLDMPLWVWLGSIETLYAVSLSIFINRYSKDKLLSVLAFVTMGLFSFSLAGLKQVMAMSFAMLAFLCFTKNCRSIKNIFVSAVLLYVAYYCHQTVMIFVPAFITYRFRSYKYYNSLLTVSILLIYIYGNVLLQNMVTALDNEHYSVYLKFSSRYSSTALIFFTVVTALGVLGYNRYKQLNRLQARFFFGMSLLVIGMQVFAFYSPDTFRLAYYYLPFTAIFVPNAILCIKKYHTIISLVTITCLVFFFLYTSRNTPYIFSI